MTRKRRGIAFARIAAVVLATAAVGLLGFVSMTLCQGLEARRRAAARLEVQEIARSWDRGAPLRLDPWGRSYLRLGGKTPGSPVFILSVGPDGLVDPGNYNHGKGPSGGTWSPSGASSDDIVVTLR